jgi:ATP-dependent Lon protease
MKRKVQKARTRKFIEEAGKWQELPLLPLRDVVVFPGMIVPLFVGRPKSVNALDFAMKSGKQVLLVTQKTVECDDPEAADLFNIGTLAGILQMLKLPDGSVKVLIEGTSRQRIHEVVQSESMLLGQSEERTEVEIGGPEVQAQVRHMQNLFERYVRLNRKIPQETLVSLLNLEDPGKLADNIAIHASLKVGDKQKILSSLDPRLRLMSLSKTLASEIEILELEQKIKGEVRRQMEKSQKEYYLNEQMKAIQKELGKDGENAEEIAELMRKVPPRTCPTRPRRRPSRRSGG